MIKNDKPINKGNADEFYEICSPVPYLGMLRYETIFDFYTEEPKIIKIQITQNDTKKNFEQILRIRRWNTAGISYGWSVYSQERDFEGEAKNYLILRQVTWDMDKDIELLKFSQKEQKKELSYKWPVIDTKNVFVDKNTSKIIKLIKKLDNEINDGIILNNKGIPKDNFRDFEIRRLYDWGLLKVVWSPFKENDNLKIKINDLIIHMEKIINSTHDNIISMELDYTILPEYYKKIAYGED